MARYGRTWWGRRFIEALETFSDPGRLSRGRSYATNGRIKSYTIKDGSVRAKVRGQINPYFGVYKEPLYTTSVAMTHIPHAAWHGLIGELGSRAGFVARLLANEMPDGIEQAFKDVNRHLLPYSAQDFSTSCSCPDFSEPCKHVAGVCYLLANQLDRDPFLLFELRGLPRAELLAELAETPLGRVLAESLTTQAAALAPSASYFTVPVPAAQPLSTTLKAFWHGEQPLPPRPDPATRVPIPALLIKKHGDYPPFWHKDASFIETMEDLYERVRTKSPQLR